MVRFAAAARRTRRGLLVVGGLASALSGCGDLGGASSSHSELAPSRESQVFVVRSDGEELRKLTHGRRSHWSPSWSPDGRRLVYTSSCGLETIRPDGSRRRALLRRSRRCPTAVSWSPQGDLIAFAALAEDPGPSTIETIKPNGSHPRQIDGFHDERGQDEQERPDWTPNGKWIVYSRFISLPVPPGELVSPSRAKLVSARVDRRGRRQVTAGAHFDASPRWSPDGRKIAFVRVDNQKDPLSLLVVDTRGGAPRRVLDDLVDVSDPVWSPSGRQIAFNGGTTSGDRRYHLNLVDARGRRRQLTGEVEDSPAWSPDGTRIAYADDGRVRVVAPDGSDQRTLTKLPGGEISGLSWSADGRQLAFTARKRPPED